MNATSRPSPERGARTSLRQRRPVCREFNGAWLSASTGTTWIDYQSQPSTTYTYTVYPLDRHFNYGPSSSVQVTTPATGSVNPRQIGVRKNGSYYGAVGENIDLQSGNLNLTIPLFKAVGRGMTAPVNLVYNSQLWRKDSGGVWRRGRPGRR